MEDSLFMDNLFKRKYSGRPLWLCILLTTLVLSVSVIVATNTAGILDFVFQSQPPHLEYVEYVLPRRGDSEMVSKMVTKIDERAERGIFSYYLEAYPLIMYLELLASVELGSVSMSTTPYVYDSLDEQSQAYADLQLESREKQAISFMDRLFLTGFLTIVYRILSLILACWVISIPTGLGTRIQYWLVTRKMRWVF